MDYWVAILLDEGYFNQVLRVFNTEDEVNEFVDSQTNLFDAGVNAMYRESSKDREYIVDEDERCRLLIVNNSQQRY